MKKNIRFVVGAESKDRMQPLWDQVQKGLQDLGCGVSFDFNTTFDLKTLKHEDVYYVTPRESEVHVKEFQVLPTAVRLAGIFDFVINEGDRIIPRLVLAEALKTTLVKQARALDISHPALVVGQNANVGAVVSALSMLGFKEIYLVGQKEELEDHVQDLSRMLVGLKFIILQSSELTTREITASLIVNIPPFTESDDTYMDLAYFNYLKSDGWVLDISNLSENSLLIEEALRADLSIVPAKTFCEFYAQALIREIVNRT